MQEVSHIRQTTGREMGGGPPSRLLLGALRGPGAVVLREETVVVARSVERGRHGVRNVDGVVGVGGQLPGARERVAAVPQPVAERPEVLEVLRIGPVGVVEEPDLGDQVGDPEGDGMGFLEACLDVRVAVTRAGGPERGLALPHRLLELAELTRAQIPTGRALSRTSAERILKYVDAMGSFFCKAGDLVLLGLYASDEEPLTIMQLVDALGLLQPTVSMSVASLAARGLVTRDHEASGSHTTSVSLTREGRAAAADITARIEEIVVRRKARKSAEAE